MNLLTPKVLLFAVSAWKMLSYIALLLCNAESILSEVDTSVNMVYMNVILAYAIYYQIPNTINLIQVSVAEAGVMKDDLQRISFEVMNNRKNMGPDRDAILSKTALQYNSRIKEISKALNED